jgi:hypothetical protein
MRAIAVFALLLAGCSNDDLTYLKTHHLLSGRPKTVTPSDVQEQINSSRYQTQEQMRQDTYSSQVRQNIGMPLP